MSRAISKIFRPDERNLRGRGKLSPDGLQILRPYRPASDPRQIYWRGKDCDGKVQIGWMFRPVNDPRQIRLRSESKTCSPQPTVCCIAGACVEGMTPEECVNAGGSLLARPNCDGVVCASCCSLGHSERYVNIEISGLGGTVDAINMPFGQDPSTGAMICGSCSYNLAELNQTISACACWMGHEYPKQSEQPMCQWFPPPDVGYVGLRENVWSSQVLPNNNPLKQPGDPECFLRVLGFGAIMSAGGVGWHWEVQIAAYGVGYYDQEIDVWPVIPRTAGSILNDCLPPDTESPSGGAVTGTYQCLFYRENACGGAGIVSFNGLTKGRAQVRWTDTPLNPDIGDEYGCY